MLGFLLSVALASSGPGPAPEIDRIVVLSMQAKPEVRSLADELTELLLSTVRDALPRATVIGQSELTAMLALEQQKQALGCEDTTCLAELGGALGADHLINGRLGKIGGTFLLSLKLIHTPSATVVQHASERISGDEEKLIQTTIRATQLLLGSAAAQAPTSTTMAATEPMPVDVSRASGETPWYGRWWVWTLGGAVLAGGIVTAVALSAGDAGDSSPQPLVNGNVEIDIAP